MEKNNQETVTRELTMEQLDLLGEAICLKVATLKSSIAGLGISSEASFLEERKAQLEELFFDLMGNRADTMLARHSSLFNG